MRRASSGAGAGTGGGAGSPGAKKSIQTAGDGRPRRAGRVGGVCAAGRPRSPLPAARPARAPLAPQPPSRTQPPMSVLVAALARRGPRAALVARGGGGGPVSLNKPAAQKVGLM